LTKLADDGLLHSTNYSTDTGLMNVGMTTLNEAMNTNNDDQHDSRICTTLLNPKLK